MLIRMLTYADTIKVLLHNMRRACLFLRPRALTLPPPRNRKVLSLLALLVQQYKY
jgi:hypothetical protein